MTDLEWVFSRLRWKYPNVNCERPTACLRIVRIRLWRIAHVNLLFPRLDISRAWTLIHSSRIFSTSACSSSIWPAYAGERRSNRAWFICRRSCGRDVTTRVARQSCQIMTISRKETRTCTDRGLFCKIIFQPGEVRSWLCEIFDNTCVLIWSFTSAMEDAKDRVRQNGY